MISNESFEENRTNKRIFLLSGIVLVTNIIHQLKSFKYISKLPFCHFFDISTVNPAYAIDPNINDESGFTFDIGTRGNVNNFVNYDISGFIINYDNRIGFIQKVLEDGNVKLLEQILDKQLFTGLKG